jgi:hypothetical protein
MKPILSVLVATAMFVQAAALVQAGAPASDPSSPATAPAIPVDQQNSLKARSLLDQMIQALGGQAYLRIEDISQEGRTYSFHLGRPNSAGTVFWRFYKFPDKDRVELTKKRDVVEIFAGDKGYEVTYKGTRPNDTKELADYLRRRHYALDWVLRNWISEKGVALFYEGQTIADQKSAEQVTVMNSRNEAVTLYIDVNSHLPVKKSFSWRDPSDKQRNVEDEVYDNYRPIQGVMTPFDITRYYNGDMSNQRFLTSVTFNKGLSDALFDANPSNK